MNDYANTTFVQHLRLSILKLLAHDGGGYSANDSILTDALEEHGFKVARDKVKTEIAWLAEQGLVTREDVGHLVVATLTQRGGDVAAGRATVPGVKRPSPR